MKKVSLVLVAAMLLSAGSIFANNVKKGVKAPKAQNLSEQISSILNNNNLTEYHLGQEAEVLFMLNSDKEIVVLSVDTDKEDMEKFIKSKLNYQEVALDNYKEGKKYTVAVRIAS